MDILRLLPLAQSELSRTPSGFLSAPFSVSRPTIHEYVTLLERVFLVEELLPWHTNPSTSLRASRLSRLVKTPIERVAVKPWERCRGCGVCRRHGEFDEASTSRLRRARVS